MHSVSPRALRTAALLVVGLFGASCSDASGDEEGRIPDVILRHALVLKLTGAPEVTARLIVEESLNGEGAVTLLAYGSEMEGTYTVQDDSLSVRFPSVDESGVWLPRSATFCADRMHVDTLDLTYEIEGDKIVGVHGSGSGETSRWLDNDAPYGIPYEFEVAGTQEVEAPVVLTYSEGLHPIGNVEAYVGGRVIAVSFPFRENSADTAFGTIARPPVHTALFTYRPTEERPLAWGTTYSIVPSGFDADSLNRPIKGASFTTVAAPAFFDTPGFEGTASVLLSGGATISGEADVGFRAPKEGAHALSLSSGGAATFVFPASQGQAPTNLVMRVRYHTESYLPYDVPAAMGVTFFDDAEVVGVLVNPDAGFSTDGINEIEGTAIATLIVPLPELAHAGAFSVVVATSYSGSCGSLPLPRSEAVIEELRLE